MSDHNLTEADNIELEAFYDDRVKQDWGREKLDIDRWTKYGHDRLYINSGIPKANKYSLYVDLETHEIVSNNTSKHSGGNVEINGDEATITIEESKGKYEHEITVTLNGDEFEPVEDNETHECEECGDEFESEHGVAVHAGIVHTDDEDEETETTTADQNTSQAIVADGGEEIRDAREVRHSDDEVRHYSADGTLYAYREDGEHVVVSQGKEPATKWTKRVPARRTAVAPGEQLWTIPDNWQHYCNIRDTDVSTYAVYHIPGPDVEVLVSAPTKTHLVDAWYGVKRVGELTATYDDEIDWDELREFVDEFEDRDEVDEEVLDALRSLYRRSTSVENDFEQAVNEFALESLERTYGLDDHANTLEDWTVDPWGEHAFQSDDIVRDHLTHHGDVDDEVLEELSRLSVIPRYPRVRVDVESGVGLPKGYHMRALTQAGMTPPEALDYRMVEQLEMSQSEWARERGIAQPSVSSNVTQAKRKLMK